MKKDECASPAPDVSRTGERRWRTLLTLFREMFLLAACVLGGGYVILTVADERFSKKFSWLRPGELFEALPLFQMIPGIIGGHTAVYIGNRVAGPVGALVAVLGMILPSVLIFTVISITYKSIPVGSPQLTATFLGLRAALTGLLLEIVLRTFRKSITGLYGPLAAITAVAAILLGGIPPSHVILISMLAGFCITFIQTRRASNGPHDDTRAFRSFWAIPVLFMGYGLMAFGGGFVLVPVFLRDFIGESAPYLQMSAGDFANVMALTEMTPGPVAANCATFFGYSLAGIGGALVATFALVLPGSTILLLALRSIDRFRSSVLVRGILFGVRPVTTALLVCATWTFAGMSVWQKTPDGFSFSPLATALAVATLLAVRMRRLGAVVAILLSAAVALLGKLLFPGLL